MENSTESETSKPKRWSRFAEIAFGMVVLGVCWYFFSIPEEGNSWVHVVRIPLLLLGMLLVTSPFSKFLKKYFFTRIFYWGLQLVAIVVFLLVYAFSLFGRLMIAMMFVFVLTTVLISKTLEYLEIQNPLDTGLFLAFTLSAILFSFKGNQIVNWLALKMEGGDSQKIEGDLKIINKYLGHTQIKYVIYLLYFVLIIVFTVLHLIGRLPNENDQNFMFLTLQSFAAFVAFDTLFEKRLLMKPWLDLALSIEGGYRELKKKQLKGAFREGDEEKS